VTAAAPLAVSPALAANGLALRPAAAQDEPFLRGLFRAVRWDEFGPLGWPDAERARFIDTQFDFQRRHYAAAFPQAELYVVERRGAPIGKLELDRQPRQIHLIDIALSPEHRGGGVGAALLALLQAEAQASGLAAVRLDVEVGNPARRLYERLGFVDVPPDDDLPRLSREMVWAP
jgi:ribosomal protein S18 acetylase RimI-like enzyme